MKPENKKNSRCRYCGEYGPWDDHCCARKSCVCEYDEACRWAKQAVDRILSHYPANYFEAH